jgi:chromosome segregation and condensation protein ScpB
MIGERIYGDVDQLMSLHLIHSEPHGATELLTTTRLFPEYFGIYSTKPEEIREFLAKKVIGHVVKEKKAEPLAEEVPSTADEPTEEAPSETRMEKET